MKQNLIFLFLNKGGTKKNQKSSQIETSICEVKMFFFLNLSSVINISKRS